MTAECCNSEFMTAVAENDDTEPAHCTAESDVLSNRPVIDMMGVRDVSSGCLKRSACINQLNAKKRNIMIEDSSSTAAADNNQLIESNEAAVMNTSLTSDGSSSVENGEDRCLLNTFTGMLFKVKCRV